VKKLIILAVLAALVIVTGLPRLFRRDPGDLPLRSTPAAYGHLTRGLHWASATLVIAAFTMGLFVAILPESRASIEAELAKGGYDLGIAWDGDYDRCFLLDEKGNFIEGYYIVGLLAKAILSDNPGASIIYDPRLTWNTLEIVAEALGMKVILDWVANHTAWDHPWITQHPEWYKRNAAGEIVSYNFDNGREVEYWTDVVGLDYKQQALWPAQHKLWTTSSEGLAGAGDFLEESTPRLDSI